MDDIFSDLKDQLKKLTCYKPMTEDVTNDPKEWDKFWYESESEGLEFIDDGLPTEDELNREHVITFTEGEVSTILYYLDSALTDVPENKLPPEIDSIYAKLETCSDDWICRTSPTLSAIWSNLW